MSERFQRADEALDWSRCLADMAVSYPLALKPVSVLAQVGNRARVELAHVKGLVAALVDAAADLAEVLASGGMHHA
jgi:hypothetical protein